ncbi:hypothetical protein OIU74_000228 [Salix koriyanagi]|uniref:Uncharacterized protein n=1 Tax=Salix koriyanagi TaxID=2511006 RepID=A0A9Q0X047_9ROSI|nr:hypothetical protein OIU74_000228 [Salix koriyanagi]
MQLFDSTKHCFRSPDRSFKFIFQLDGIQLLIFCLRPIFVRGFAASLHLVLLLALFVSFVFNKLRVGGGGGDQGSKERFSNNKRSATFNWYTNGWSDDKLVTLLDFVLTALSWAALSVYLHIPVLQISYVGFSRNKCQDTLLEQPLLNGDSSSINGLESSKYRGGDSVNPLRKCWSFQYSHLLLDGSSYCFWQ